MSATICALRCLVRGKSSRLSKLWHEQDQFQGRVGEGKDICLADVTVVANMWLWCGCGGSSVQERCGGWVGFGIICFSFLGYRLRLHREDASKEISFVAIFANHL